MPTTYTDEGILVADLIYGRGDDPREMAPEPSLLPHLGARLCHGYSIHDVLRITLDIVRQPGSAPPFPPLWEATVWGIAKREDLGDSLDDFGVINSDYWQVVRTLQTHDAARAATLANAGISIGADYPDEAGLARLSPLLRPDEVSRLLDPSSISPMDLDSESVRSLLSAANLHAIEVPSAWLDDALRDNWFGINEESHLVHLLPDLPPALRTTIADRLAGLVSNWNLPPDQRALWVSRIAPFVSSSSAWHPGSLLDALSPVWREHIKWLQSAKWPQEPWDDVFRAHPAHELIAGVKRPHEVTAGAPQDVMANWGPPDVAMAAPPPERGASMPDIPSSHARADVRGAPDPDAPRRLQADVKYQSSGRTVNAFVANQEHRVSVSIGRHGRIRANADVESKLKKLFDETDAERLDLPVWFHYDKERQEGSITVPRKLREDSTACDFSLTAPDNGHVVARIHLMRPGGRLLLQSAALIGDVVQNIDDAERHGNEMQLNVDVLAGNLGDPTRDTSGHMLVADRDVALTRSEGKIIELQLAELQNQLRNLVSEIEFSADAQDFDDKTMEDTLRRLALAGRALWVKFRRQLQELASSEYLQIVSLLDDYMLPLELVYDGPALSASSTLCPKWRDALDSGECATCNGPDGDNDGPAHICPLKFWSMSKIIERRLADAHGGAFRVRGERSLESPALRSIGGMIVSASSRVETSRVEELADFAENTLHIGVKRAKDWSEWVKAVNSMNPELLVAMPHNEGIEGGLISALLLGEPNDGADPPPDESALAAGNVTNAYVQTSDAMPGPIVLLLGCDTQYEQGKLAGFAGEFRDNGAALTVGTIGKLRADQATLAAEMLIGKIMSNSFRGAGIGWAIREARRELLSKNLIMALLLVANGDAEWTLPS